MVDQPDVGVGHAHAIAQEIEVLVHRDVVVVATTRDEQDPTAVVRREDARPVSGQINVDPVAHGGDELSLCKGRYRQWRLRNGC